MSALSEFGKTKTPTLIGGSPLSNFGKSTIKTNLNNLSSLSNFGTTKKSNIDSSEGLYNLAEQNGLKDRADEILKKQTGEKTKEIFSGGFISDIFDVLNTAQYGVTGLLKGKSFLEGVKTRQSFTDKDALGDKGLPGVIAGIALDVAVDPLTYIAPTTIIKKIPFATQAIKGAKEFTFGKQATKAIEGTEKTYETLEGGTNLGKWMASKFSWMFGADPVFKKTYERSVKNIAVGTQTIADMAKSVSKIDPDLASKILSKDEAGRFVRSPLETLQNVLKPNEFEVVSKFYNTIDDLGKQAVDNGLLSKEKFEENMGEYIKNAYSEYELAKGSGLFGTKPIGIKGIKERKAVENVSEFGLTQVDNPAYLLFKSAFDLTRDVENAKLLKTVSEKFATDVAQDGFVKMGQGKRLGVLAGKYIPENMANYINEVVDPVKNNLAKQLVANFKFFKVVMNPGTHARNIISNKILNYWKLGMNPLDPRVIKSDAIALKEIAKGAGQWSDEAKPLGYNLNTFASQEVKTLLDSPEASIMNKAGGLWKTAKQKLGDLYQAEENHAKLSAYIFNRTTRGLSPEEAWKAAESATFNYAQVTPFVRKLRESLFGFPFITFTVKSTPAVLETAMKNPERISAIGKIKQGIENLSDLKQTDRERQSEPAWVKDGFYIKLPIKDKYGRSAYFDLTYILPFGDLVAGNFFERGQNMQTGLPESVVTSTMNKSPFLQLVTSIGKNKDFYGNKIWRESDPSETQLKDLMTYLTKSYVPPLLADQLPGGYDEKGERQYKGIKGALESSSENQKRTLMQELLRNVGAKIQPIDADIQETFQEWNKKKALQNLLLENGKLDSFNRVYLPKTKK